MKNKLLVEGKDDLHVIDHLCIRLGINKNFDIINKEGYNNLKEGLPIDIKTNSDTIDIIGVVIDADENIENRWKEIKSIFIKNGYPMPENPELGGIIRKHPDSSTTQPLSVGLWIMPNNIISGELEDFLAMLIPQNDQLRGIAIDSIDRVQQEIEEKFRFLNSSRSKALIHTYLAWQKEPGKPMGQSITKKYFDADAALAKLFVQWLNGLFNQPPDNQ